MSADGLYDRPRRRSQEPPGSALPTWAAAALLAAAYAHNLLLGWRAWGDPVVDTGRELEVARQLAEGRWLYADVRYYYGPLAPYLNAALFRILGVHVDVLMAAGLVSAALMCALVYALGERVAGRLGGTAVAAAFLYLCAFPHLSSAAIFNWVLPYAYPATYGMLAATASLWLLARHLAARRRRDAVLSVVCLGLAALAKLEALLPAAAVHALFPLAAGPGRRLPVRPYLLVAAAVAAVYGTFAIVAGWPLVTESLAGPLNARSLPIVWRFMGFADWPASGVALLQSVAAFLAVLLASIAAGRLAGVACAGRTGSLATMVASAGVAVAVYAILPSQRALRFLPWLALLLLLVDARRMRGGSTPDDSSLTRTLVWAFAAASLIRMPLFAGAEHYGFYLLPVPLVALGAFLFRVAPRAFADRGPAPSVCAGLAILATIVARHAAESGARYARHTVHVQAPRGDVYLLADVVGTTYAEAVRRLARLPPGTRVLALPQGVGLAFLAGLRSWDGMQSFLPPDVPTPDADARLAARLDRDPPDVVLWIGMDLREYGTAGLGVDYATTTLAWIKAHYRTTAALPPKGYVLFMTPR